MNDEPEEEDGPLWQWLLIIGGILAVLYTLRWADLIRL